MATLATDLTAMVIQLQQIIGGAGQGGAVGSTSVPATSGQSENAFYDAIPPVNKYDSGQTPAKVPEPVSVGGRDVVIPLGEDDF